MGGTRPARPPPGCPSFASDNAQNARQRSDALRPLRAGRFPEPRARLDPRARTSPGSDTGVAFLLRGLCVKALGGKPVDVVSIGAKMRLYPFNNVCEKRILFTPQYFDEAERDLLKSRITPEFVFIDIGANVGGYALFVAAQCGPAGAHPRDRAAAGNLRAADLQHPPEPVRDREGDGLRAGRRGRRDHAVPALAQSRRKLGAHRQRGSGRNAGARARAHAQGRRATRKATRASTP